MTIIAARSWSRFKIRHLAVVSELLGAKHSFGFSDKRIEVRIPDFESDSKRGPSDRLIRGYGKEQDDGKLSHYAIDSVDLFIDVDEMLDIPQEALDLPPVQTKLFTASQKARLSAIVNEHEAIGIAAVRHWLHIVRLKTRTPLIGQPSIAREESGWRTYLFSDESKQGFWTSNVVLEAMASHLITEHEWQSIQATLTAGVPIPEFFTFIFDALHRLRNNDIAAAVLSAAIALELIMRSLLSMHLSAESAREPIITTMLDLTNLRSIINHRKKMTLWDTGFEQVFDNSAFNELMNARDAIMHRADLRVLEVPDWRKVFYQLLEFAYYIEEHLK